MSGRMGWRLRLEYSQEALMMKVLNQFVMSSVWVLNPSRLTSDESLDKELEDWEREEREKGKVLRVLPSGRWVPRNQG